jgi:hypothetical protein
MSIAVLFFALMSGLMFCLALKLAARPLSLLIGGARVTGTVVSEHLFKSDGTRARFYRVAFPLSTGQRATLRSAAIAAWLSAPELGAEVDVLVTERSRQPKACIASWREMWLGSFVCLVIGAGFGAFAALAYRL